MCLLGKPITGCVYLLTNQSQAMFVVQGGGGQSIISINCTVLAPLSQFGVPICRYAVCLYMCVCVCLYVCSGCEGEWVYRAHGAKNKPNLPRELGEGRTNITLAKLFRYIKS